MLTYKRALHSRIKKFGDMNCLFFFKSKKPKSLNKNDEESRRGKESLQKSSPESIRELRKQGEQNLKVFSYKELSHATRDFIRKLKIGEGGFGSVYKATIPNYFPSNPNSPPLIVAIKKLNQQGLQGHKQWLAEVQFLGVVNHPNVVRLLGYCSEDKETEIQRLLVYEFMSNLSLDDHLFTRTTPTLPWKQRLKIMLGAAQGLAYLHEIQVIYRDFKSSNVLLDNDFNPKLSDFGLAREGPEEDATHVTTARVGTQGYAAPEYVQTGHLRTQSDVYSFGVVLYEIITGRRAIDRRKPVAQQKLLEWVKQYPVESKSFCLIIDSKLRNNYSIDMVKRVAKLAEHCLNKIDKERPTMDFIVDCLKRIIQESDKST